MTDTIPTMYVGRGAELYDEIARVDVTEIRELLHEVRTVRGRVLELAAGSGRLTLPLLAFCHEIVAVDISADLLAILAERAARTVPAAHVARLRVVEGDLRDLRNLGDLGSFDHVVLGTTSISLFPPAERAGLYADVADRLAPGGRFLLSLRVAPSAAPGQRVHRLEDGLQLEERVDEDGVLIAGLREDGALEHVHEVRTYPISRSTLLAELDQAGFDVVADVAVGGASLAPGIGSYSLFTVVLRGA